MRELRLKYIINLVSDIAAKAKTDEQALTQAQKAVQEELKRTGREATVLERVMTRAMLAGTKGADQQAARLAQLALRYQDVRKAAEGAANAMQKAATVATGAAAGAYAVDRMAKAPMEYSLRLANMANTAYADRDVPGRISGKRTLNAAITAALRTGGGSRDEAAGALDTLIASGAVGIDQAIGLLPMLMKGSTASGATADQLANIALKGMQTFRISQVELPEVLNMAMAAGQAGGFELKDMAKELPKLLATANLAGMSGKEDFRRILSSLQAQVIVAGGKPEAAGNLVNLLSKIQSPDVAGNLAKFSVNGTQRLVADRAAGVNPLDSFVGLVDEIVGKDTAYQRLQGELRKAGTSGERAATLESMAKLLEGSAVGKVIQDREAMMGLAAELNNRSYIQSVMQKTRTNTGAMDTSFEVVAEELSSSRQKVVNAFENASSTALDALTPAMRAAADGTAALSEKYPGLTAGLVGATGAAVAFTAALGASGLIGMLTGRAGGAGGVIGTVATVAGGALLPAAGVAAAGTFAGYQGLQLFDAARDLYNIKNREGVVLTQAAQARLTTLPLDTDFTKFTQPGRLTAAEGGGLGVPGLTLGEGRLAIDVLVTDDRVSATTRLDKPMSLVRIDNGNTNPAGYGGVR